MNVCNVDLMIDMKKLKTKLDNTMYRWNLKKDIQHLFFYKDIEILVSSGIKPIIIHGGGPQINDTLKALKIKHEFYI